MRCEIWVLSRKKYVKLIASYDIRKGLNLRVSIHLDPFTCYGLHCFLPLQPNSNFSFPFLISRKTRYIAPIKLIHKCGTFFERLCQKIIFRHIPRTLNRNYVLVCLKWPMTMRRKGERNSFENPISHLIYACMSYTCRPFGIFTRQCRNVAKFFITKISISIW